MNKTTVDRVLSIAAAAEEMSPPTVAEFPFDESASIEPETDIERWDGLS